MPTTYTDQFWLIDPFAPPPVGTVLTVNVWDLVDADDDNDIEAAGGDSVNGLDVTQSYPGDTVTVNVPGVGNVTYTGTTFYLSDGTQVFTPTDGQVLQEGPLVSTTFVNTQGPLDVGDLGPTCFTPGVMIRMANGQRAVEQLQEGDLVKTLDHGVQPVRRVLRTEVRADGAFAPVRIKAGALGNPRDLVVSQQHRILITGWRAELFYGETEVLVAAKHLVNDDTIRIEPGARVTYIHLLFDRHELVWSDGVLTESFFAYADDAAEEGPRAELFALYPELHEIAHPHLARPAMRAFEGALMLA